VKVGAPGVGVPTLKTLGLERFLLSYSRRSAPCPFRCGASPQPNKVEELEGAPFSLSRSCWRSVRGFGPGSEGRAVTAKIGEDRRRTLPVGRLHVDG